LRNSLGTGKDGPKAKSEEKAFVRRKYFLSHHLVVKANGLEFQKPKNLFEKIADRKKTAERA